VATFEKLRPEMAESVHTLREANLGVLRQKRVGGSLPTVAMRDEYMGRRELYRVAFNLAACGDATAEAVLFAL